MHQLLDYEHNTVNNKGSTHYHKNDTANSHCGTLIIGVCESILSIAQPNMAVSHIIMSIANLITNLKAANCESHRTI